MFKKLEPDNCQFCLIHYLINQWLLWKYAVGNQSYSVPASKCPVVLSLQSLSAGPFGERGKIHPRDPNQAPPSTQWLYTGHLLWPPLLTEQRSRAKRRWTVFPANAHRTTEVPLIGLTLRSIPLPHRSLHSTHVLPLIPRCCTPLPFTHYLQRDSSHSAKDALLYVYIPLSLKRTR